MKKNIHLKELKFFRLDIFAEEQLFCLRMILGGGMAWICNI